MDQGTTTRGGGATPAAPRAITLATLRLLVLTLLASVLTVLGAEAPAEAATNGGQSFSNARIAEVAKTYNGQSARTGFDQPGECIAWVRRWVAEAGGSLPKGTPISIYRKAGGVEIPLDQARPGDIFQRSKGDTWEGSPHTGVIGSSRAADGTFEIIEGNYDFKGTVRITRYRPSAKYAGHELRVWRLGNVGPVAPTGSFDGASVPTNGKVRVTGWAFDDDDRSASLAIHLYIGGKAGQSGAVGHNLGPARTYRPDVHRLHRAGERHGFDATVTTAKRGPQPACVYAISVGGGPNRFLGCRTVNPDGPVRTVAVRSVANGKYVSAEVQYSGAEAGMLRARAGSAQAWELFDILGDCSKSCQIRARANGRLVSAELDYQGAAWGMARARATQAGGWEMFRTVGDCSTGCGIQSLANGRYLSAELEYSGSGAGMLRARAESVGGWERFVLVPASRTGDEPEKAMGTTLRRGERITSGRYIEANGYRFHVQASDGNQVLYNRSGKAIWATNRMGAAYVVLQGDQNLVAYTSAGRAVWASNTVGSDADRLVMQTDGNLVLYAGSRPVWATNTVGR